METRYDSKNQSAVIFEVPVCERDYDALKSFFGERLFYVLAQDKLDNGLEKGAVKFKGGKVYGVDFRDVTIHKDRLEGLFSGLKDLEIISLNGCYLKELPTSVYGLSNLKELYFMDNRVKEISSEIKNLKSLETMDLHANYDLKIPEEILELGNLKYLVVDSKSLLNGSKNVIEKLKEKGCLVQGI